MEFFSYRIGEIFERFSSGKSLTEDKITTTGKFPVFGGNGLRGFTDFCNFDGECILIGRQGAKCGNVRYFCGQGYMTDHAIVGVCKKTHNSRFLSYALAGLDLNRLSGQAAQPGLSVGMLKKQKILLPPLHVQNRIADILYGYNDLIENNNRRIRILEQMAESQYKECFSYEKAKKASSEVRLKEIIQIVRGLSYSTEEIDVDKGNNLVNLKNIQAFGGFRHEGTKLYAGKYKNEQIVCCGDLIMGVTDMTQDRRTVGSVALVPKIDGISVISADLIKILSEIDNMFLFAMFKYGNVSKHISQFANGANVLHLRPQVMLNIKVMLPSQDMIDKYVFFAKPLFGKIEQLNQANKNLIKQRDMLLPRLMSGKLGVKE